MDFSITNLSVAFGKNIVVKNVSVEFKKNKIIAIIGPSGCGKTTFLRCLNRLNDLVSNCNVSGSIKYKNVELNDKKCDTIELRKKIGMVFQAPNPFRKTIYKNARYGLKIQGIRHKNKLDDIVEKSLKKVVLWEEVKDKLNNSAFTLSGGQQQRLCIARALAIQPEVILLDEPTSALDPISSRKIEELLVSLKKEYTIIIVTHSLNQAQRISDYVGMFYDGELIEYGKTSDVFDNPKNNITKMYIENKLD